MSQKSLIQKTGKILDFYTILQIKFFNLANFTYYVTNIFSSILEKRISIYLVLLTINSAVWSSKLYHKWQIYNSFFSSSKIFDQIAFFIRF